MALVGLEAIESDRGDEAVDSALAQEAPSGRKVGRATQARQVVDGRPPRTEQEGAVLQGLDVPALDAAGKSGRDAGRDLLLRGHRDPRRHGRG